MSSIWWYLHDKRATQEFYTLDVDQGLSCDLAVHHVASHTRVIALQTNSCGNASSALLLMPCCIIPLVSLSRLDRSAEHPLHMLHMEYVSIEVLSQTDSSLGAALSPVT